jgi:hypothetical protein
MASGGIGNQSPASLFQARLDTTDGVNNLLTLKQYQGNKVVVSGVTVVIPGGGLTVSVAANLIDPAGADFGSPGVASTLYYVYISNARSPFAPSSIRLCATAPTLVNGVKYLGAAGNALNWRFVGWVFLNATPQFESSLTGRLIVNYYNRLLLKLFTCPGYVDDNAATLYLCNNTVWDQISKGTVTGGVDSRVTYIANGEDAQSFKIAGSADNTVGRPGLIGLGIDTPNTSKVEAILDNPTAGDISIHETYEDVGVEGHHTADLLGMQTAVNPMNVFADDVRNGGTKDPFLTYLTGTLFA